jgi:hypothetical protein
MTYFNVSSQDFNTIKDKLYWGGNFGLSFGTYTYIQIAPVVSYAVTDDFYVGLGIDYTYFKDNRNQFYTYEGSTWAPRLFARYFVFEDLFLHAEFTQVYYKDVYNPLNPSNWATYHRFYGGGGYRSWIGPNSYTFVMLLFDLESNEFDFGINPLIQIGFASGF